MKEEWKKIQRHLGLYDGGIPGIDTAQAIIAALEIPDLQPPLGGVRERMVRIALGEVGIREEPMDSNSGEWVESYQAATWLEGTGWPWCAAFVCWVVERARVEGGEYSWVRPRTPGAWAFEGWAKKQTGVELMMPDECEIMAGDILVYTFSHIGIAVAGVVNNQVRTVEGNTNGTGGREGGGVYERFRSVRKIRSVIRIK